MSNNTHRNTNNNNGSFKNMRAYNWCLTINNFDLSKIDEMLSLDTKHLVFQSEIEESGTSHLQVLIGFPFQKSFQQMKKIFPRAHIEKCRNLQASCNYCSKNDTWNGFYRYDKRKNKVLKSQIAQSPEDPTDRPSRPDFGPNSYPSKEWLDWIHKEYCDYLLHTVYNEQNSTMLATLTNGNFLPEGN